MMNTTTAETTLIQPMPVQRDELGHWSHPGIPDFDEDHAAYKAWLQAQGLEIKYRMLEDEADDHPVYHAYFEQGEGDMSAWAPEAPAGDGWFTLSIHDTEDGPVWVWARREGAAA
nr:hypothetical protein [uncultured Massilia sp.]